MTAEIPQRAVQNIPGLFAPVAEGSKDGVGGIIKKLERDFSKVRESGVAPDSLNMTAIVRSMFTTKAKIKGKDSVHANKGIKAKFNKNEERNQQDRLQSQRP